MSEAEANVKVATGKVPGWMKGMVGGMAGLLSGAIMMYVTGFVNTVIKPAKPIANFAVDHQGLSVTFHNRSNTGDSGWWDFGDGSPLEPATSKTESVAHTYPKPGTYTAKLSLRNLLNEESDRTVAIDLTEGPANETPEIATFYAVPVSRGSYAPATFRLVSRVKSTQLLVWDFGDERPFEVDAEPGNDHERLVTFQKPGGWVVKLAAVNGRQVVEKSEVVCVDVAPENSVTAFLTVTEEASKREQIEDSISLTESFLATNKADKQSIARQVPVRQGFDITDAKLEVIAGQTNVRDLKIQVAADRKSALLSGELVRPAAGVFSKQKNLPTLTLKVVLTEEKKTPVKRPPVQVTTTLKVPGTGYLAMPPVPAGWVDVRYQMRLELRDGNTIIWPESQLPRNASITVNGRSCTLSAVQASDQQVRIDLVDSRPGTPPTAN